MKTKRFGRTGKDVSAIGFGGMRFSKPQDHERNADLVRFAHARGITYFDTAPAYCDDQSERIFGLALPGLSRSSYCVSTKSAKANGAELRAELERSLERLRLDRVDFLHVWCLMSLEDWERRLNGGAVEAALRAREDGLVDHIVCSSHMPGEDLRRVLESGAFEGVTLGYNAINFPYRKEAVLAAAELGLGVVAMNPLSGGMIPRDPARFAFLQRPGDPSVVSGALRFLVHDPKVTVALVGFSCEGEVEEAVAAAGEESDAEAHRADLLQHIEKGFDDVCTGCGYCLPCPEQIPIPRYMDAYNVRVLGGNDDEIRDRFFWHWSIKHDHAAECSECGDCETRCTQHLPIRERLKQMPKPRA